MLIGNKNIAIDSNTIKNVFRIICINFVFFEAVPCDCVKVFKLVTINILCKANKK
jgi:hypothetical protein